MKIYFNSWRGVDYFAKHGLNYSNLNPIDGDESDVMRIAAECYAKGLDVMITRSYEHVAKRHRKADEPSERLIGYAISVDMNKFRV